MSKFHRLWVLLSCASFLLTLSPVIWADYAQEQAQNERLLKHELDVQKHLRLQKYKKQVENKALYGLTNIGTSVLEIPKNMINVTNEEDSNIVYGIVGGGIKGVLDAAARVVIGTVDVLTAPILTRQVVSPKRVWDDFDKSNTYDQVLRLDAAAYAQQSMVQTVAVKPRLPVLSDADHYSKEENNKRLDTIFENEMRK